ncbi:LytR C-terminal domain-containing protein [Leucobacter sp. wl10]|uniref:LytR C-terminal domain-containing protein n=1 Tax=Leucobacter sp. wl10 TaxID=2304677 RepID=UPI001F0910F1|nr:LytR C-terminal domain-containing protein [Leucobacter sp. wl10]
MTQTSEHTAERRDARRDHPQDRFDLVRRSGRVGAHRITARPRYVWQYLVAALLGFALLTTLGIIAVQNIGGSGSLPGARPTTGSTPSQTAQAKLNPDATVAVLNGTETPNLAAAVDQIITAKQWGQIRFSGAAAASDVTISAVFYTDPADASAAAGLAAELGGLSTYVTEDYASYEVQLVVLLGSDYAGPGLKEAQQITDGSGEGAGSSGPGVNPETGNQINPETGNDINPATGNDINPATGNDIDPATGWDIDPASGWPIDPATGAPTDPATLPAP